MRSDSSPSPLILQPWPEEAIAGRLARYIVVPEGQVAVILRNGVRALPAPGPHRILSAWEALLGRLTPSIWSLSQRTITLHPVIVRLLSYDGQLVQADLLILARISDPVRFWQEQAAGWPTLRQRDLESRLGRELRPVLQTTVQGFPIQALLHQPQAIQEVQGKIGQGLRAILQGWGMELQGVAHLGFQPARDAVKIEREIQVIRRELADIRVQAAIERMDREQMLEHARREMELDLSEADQAEMQALAQEAGDPADAWRQALEARLERLEEMAQAQMDAQVGFDDATPSLPALLHDPVEERLSDLVAVLRAAAALIVLVTTVGTIFFPHLIRDDTAWRLAGASTGFLVALLALVSSWAIHRRLHRHRAERPHRLSEAQEGAERADHWARERKIREYLVERLRRVAANCDQAWRAMYGQNDELVTAIRERCRTPYENLAKKIEAENEQANHRSQLPLLRQNALAQLLRRTQEVLDQAQSMVRLSENLYRAVVDKRFEDVRQLSQQLQKGCNEIENRFEERKEIMYLG